MFLYRTSRPPLSRRAWRAGHRVHCVPATEETQKIGAQRTALEVRPGEHQGRENKQATSLQQDEGAEAADKAEAERRRRDLRREYDKRYNQEKKELRRAYHFSTREKRREYKNQYNKIHKDRFNEYMKRYNFRNKERKREYDKLYHDKNKERRKEWREQNRLKLCNERRLRLGMLPKPQPKVLWVPRAPSSLSPL
jgi:hypothetical protein